MAASTGHGLPTWHAAVAVEVAAAVARVGAGVAAEVGAAVARVGAGVVAEVGAAVARIDAVAGVDAVTICGVPAVIGGVAADRAAVDAVTPVLRKLMLDLAGVATAVGGVVGAFVGRSVGDAVGAPVVAGVATAVGASVGAFVDGSVGAAVGAPVVCMAMRDEVGYSYSRGLSTMMEPKPTMVLISSWPPPSILIVSPT